MSIAFDDRICALGEGALWHPLREELFWFDVTGCRLLSRNPGTGGARVWHLPEMCSAAGWVDSTTLLIASETGLGLFDIEAGRFTRRLVDLEADLPANRSNDGRVDPLGGFWIGTMGKSAEPGAGAIYRFWRGGMRRLFEQVTIPNAICFAPAGDLAYFADTDRGLLFRVTLDPEGWPSTTPEVFVDFSALGLWPDGAVTAEDGSLRVALWGAGAVIAVSPSGEIGPRALFAAPHTTCPAFGGPEFDTLFCTSATQGLDRSGLERAPLSGAVFRSTSCGRGRAEPAFLPERNGDDPR